MLWEMELQESLINVENIKTQFGTSINEINRVKEKYPMRLPNYYYEVVKKNADGCLIKTCIPNILELEDQGEVDTSGEKESYVMTGVQHKYDNTVLLLTTNECAMYCRYCFRKRMVGSSTNEIVTRINQACEYIECHSEVDNVLLSGGDSFMLNTKTIENYLKRLCAIDHLSYIRFGTKIPVVFPQRIINDGKLVEILRKYGQKKQIYVITQFNHPDEITKEAQESIHILRYEGVIVRNQSVLLRGVNDSINVLCELLKKLVSIGVIPYYIFQCRPVKGAQNMFQVSMNRGYEIIEQAKKKLSGLEKNFKFICSTPAGKVEILGLYNNRLILKFHEARERNMQGKIFFQDLNTEGSWINWGVNIL